MGRQRPRVLLVDDEASLVKLIGMRLQKSGYEVLTAHDGEEAISKTRLGKPDVIILDLMMPKKNGFEVCAELKRDPDHKHIPIIVFTAKGQDMDEKVCREIGASAYITKPHTSEALIEQIEALLGGAIPPSSN